MTDLVVLFTVSAVVLYLLFRIQSLNRAIERKELEDKIDYLSRSADERFDTLSRDNALAHDTLERDLRNEIVDIQRYNDREHEEIRARLATLEE